MYKQMSEKKLHSYIIFVLVFSLLLSVFSFIEINKIVKYFVNNLQVIKMIIRDEEARNNTTIHFNGNINFSECNILILDSKDKIIANLSINHYVFIALLFNILLMISALIMYYKYTIQLKKLKRK
ncbi:hypothetical protein [Anaerophilus nitritogenes]|uniref:hypothetical protein n=1 Tax=Anaerophilus nitritogenes TaxID=2498136 RepID=UPI00101BE6CD|nr:hypothetical protein [Anaerophilus nitritogenes]